MRHNLGNPLAVDPQHHAEHPMRAGVLRPHVDHEVDGVESFLPVGLSVC